MKSTRVAWMVRLPLEKTMPQFLIRGAVVLTVATLLLAGCASTDCSSAAREMEERSKAAKVGDVEALIRDFYAKEPIIAYRGAGVTKSREEARQQWERMREQGAVELTTERVERAPGQVAEMGKWKFRVQVAQGDFREESGRYFAVWKREEGRWRVAMEWFAPEGFVEND